MTITTTIRLYLLLTFLRAFGAGCIFPIYVPYLLRNGLTIFEVSLVNSVFYWGQFFFEIPTGMLADRFGRRNSVILAWSINACSMFLFGITHSMPWFMAAELFDAIGCTFSSGAFDAWITDQLRSLQHTQSMSKVFARARLMEAIGVCLAAPSGAYLFMHSTMAPWILSTVVTFAAAVAAFMLMREDHSYATQVDETTQDPHAAASMIGALRWCLRNARLRYMLLVTTVFACAIAVPNIQWAPLTQTILGTDAWNGLVFVGVTLCVIIGLKVVQPRTLLHSNNDEERALRVLYFATGASIAVTGVALLSGSNLVTIIAGFGGYFAHEVCRGAIAPLRDGFYTHHFPPRYRATLLSVASLTHHVGGGIGLLVFGIIGSHSATLAWLLGGALLMFVALRTRMQ